MKSISISSLVVVFWLSSINILADIPIYQSADPVNDRVIDVVYNSNYDEYLILWLESNRGLSNKLMGKIVDKNGEGGTAFTLSETIKGKPSVAYNPERHEYFMVFENESGGNTNIWGQRLSSNGEPRENGALLMENAGSPAVLYNSVAGNYLVAGINRVQNINGTCDDYVYTRTIDAYGFPLGRGANTIDQKSVGCDQESTGYKIAYAPIISPETPEGRYLINYAPFGWAMMLDSDGVPLITVYDGDIPFGSDIPVDFYDKEPGNLIGEAEGWDMTFGYWGGAPVFFVVWADKDTDRSYMGNQWTGIWCGVISAENIHYDKSGGANTEHFPISKIWSHWDQYADSWNPVVSYNSFANKFMVAWRETPGTDPRDSTDKNHIRGNSMTFGEQFYTLGPPDNIVLSRVFGNEDPSNPLIAASNKEPKALVVWRDARNYDADGYDLYGNILETTSPLLHLLKPNGGEKWKEGTLHEIQWTSSPDFSAKIRIDFISDNGWFNIADNIANDGSFSWFVPPNFTSSQHGRGRIIIADTKMGYPNYFVNYEDRERYDYSDGFFKIYGNVTDFNYDSTSDILVHNTTMGTVYSWLMKNDGSRLDAIKLVTIPSDILDIEGTGDYNGDGITDILARNKTNGQTWVWLIASDGTRETYRFITTISKNDWEIAGTDSDFNNDGISDIVVRNKTYGWTYVWLMKNDGTRGRYKFITTIPVDDWEIAGTDSDFNNDGISDIVVRNKTEGWTYVWLMKNDGTRGSYKFITTIPEDDWEIAGTDSDFNSDGVSDLVVRNKTHGWIYVWIMNADGSRKNYQPVTSLPESKWEIVGTHSDFNVDGTSDIVVRNKSDGIVYTWLMNADGTRASFQAVTTIPVDDWEILGTDSDYNADHISDMTVRQISTGKTYSWLMGSTGTRSTTKLIDTIPANNWDIEAVK